MLNGDRLIYIDIGRDIVPFKPAFLVDIAARLFSIGVLGLPDGELGRRETLLKPHEALAQLNGFDQFYLELIQRLNPTMSGLEEDWIDTPRICNVTLMIKACPQDHVALIEQVTHIATQLSRPKRFAKVVLAVDPHQGRYLRQFSEGNLASLLDQAERLKAAGVINEIWVAPKTDECIEKTYRRWFGLSSVYRTHTLSGAPLYPQLDVGQAEGDGRRGGLRLPGRVVGPIAFCGATRPRARSRRNRGRGLCRAGVRNGSRPARTNRAGLECDRGYC